MSTYDDHLTNIQKVAAQLERSGKLEKLVKKQMEERLEIQTVQSNPSHRPA